METMEEESGRAKLGGLRLEPGTPIALAEAVSAGEVMSFRGVANRTAMLVGVLLVSAGFAWSSAAGSGEIAGPFWVGLVVGAVTSIAIGVRPGLAGALGWVYAGAEGACLGSLVWLVEAEVPGAAVNAFLLTIAVLAAMLVLHATRRPAEREEFRSTVIALTVAVAATYVIDLLAVLLTQGGLPFLHESGFWGTVVSVVILGIAAFNLMIDFEFVHEQVKRGAPRSLEWFAAVSIVITLAWVYVEALRLFFLLGGDDE